jgi:uncharacterized protein
VTDILRELEKPGRDPRPAFKTAVFKEGVETLKDLKPGMILEGTVTNVAAFGAFVDIGVHQDGLVHISAMSKTFIKDPREVVKSGDIVKVKVLEVEVARKRIALTLRLDEGPVLGREPGEGLAPAPGTAFPARDACCRSARRLGSAATNGGQLAHLAGVELGLLARPLAIDLGQAPPRPARRSRPGGSRHSCRSPLASHSRFAPSGVRCLPTTKRDREE